MVYFLTNFALTNISNRIMKNYNTILLSMFILTFFTSLHGQSIRYVESTGTDIGNCTDPSNACATINYAMEMAGSGDVIDIAAGVYTEQINIEKDLTFQGAGNIHPGGTIIQADVAPGQATGNVITIDGNYSIQITGLTIRHGVANNGGGLYNIDSNLTLTEVTFSENIADYGGGMYNDSGTITLTNVNFMSNTSVESGGGLNNYTPNEVIVLNDVLFSGNIAGHAAGGVALYGGDTVFNNVTFQDNIAEDSDGGGLFVSNTNATFTDTSFTNNETQSGGNGGAVFISESTADFSNAHFTSNHTLGLGGAVFITESIAAISNSTFIDNEALLGGGLLVEDQSTITLNDILFDGNKAPTSSSGMAVGGAMTVLNESEATIQNTHFKDNEASEFGGALANEAATITIINSLFTGNKASNLGGGAIANNGNLNLINTTISQNGETNVPGGGLYNLQGTITMGNSIIWDNIGDISDIYNATGAVILGNYSLYDPANSSNDGTFTCDDCLIINPEFENVAGGDFSLSGTSPAIDAGDPNTNLSVFPTDGDNNPIDITGNARVINHTIDMGAYEYGVLSIDNFNNIGLQIALYPNPVNDMLYIETDVNIESISVYTIVGQHIQTWKNQKSINISGYTAGNYFVKITTANGSEVKQVIKK